MLIKELFDHFINEATPYLAPIYVGMVGLAIIGLIVCTVLLYKKNRYAKWLGLTSLLLLINPAIYYFFS